MAATRSPPGARRGSHGRRKRLRGLPSQPPRLGLRQRPTSGLRQTYPSMAAAHKWVYHFTEGAAKMRDLLGGKGAGAAEMTRAGMPVPPGFTITTEACRAYLAGGGKMPPGLWDQATKALALLEKRAGKRFGDASNPLLVSVRSGAKFSMPGMMDTVLNLGLNEETMQGIIALSGDARFAYDAYRRFVQMFSKIVLDTKAEEFEKI